MSRILPSMLLLSTLLGATHTPVAAPEPSYSPHAAASASPSRLLWGDTHLHTSFSTDAFGFGVRLDPDTAYRFAMGEVVTSSWGQRVRLARPLDFMVIADHAESLGIMQRVQDGDGALLRDDAAANWNRMLHGTPAQQAELSAYFHDGQQRRAIFRKLTELASPDLQLDIWRELLSISERHNRPGQFTALHGYEWTAAPQGNNLHRVVLFRDGEERAGQMAPLTAFDSDRPEDLWAHMAAYEKSTGGRVLAIPHNGNLSNGLMFPAETTDSGAALDADYARLRSRWEPVYEVTQMKGDGETHPLLSPDDEFADYETWDAANFFGTPKTPAMLPHEYARAALKLGLQLQRQVGANPYQFGLIGSTDSHTGLSTPAEDNFFGKHSGVEPAPERWKTPVGKAKDWQVLGWEQTASGYAAVWATANTREAIWDALQRREVYATTGSRISVRLFGGWSFAARDAARADLAAHGYEVGVPMGAVLPPRGDAAAPSFLVAAARDPLGANLDRIQMVKGWVDTQGRAHEMVYDVVWSQGDSRPRDARGKVPAVGNTVDVAAATWDNSIGAAELATVWRDPQFDPQQPAFYYARVLEIPTPRWTAYDAARYRVNMPQEVPMITVERAYTSPLWYRP